MQSLSSKTLAQFLLICCAVSFSPPPPQPHCDVRLDFSTGVAGISTTWPVDKILAALKIPRKETLPPSDPEFSRPTADPSLLQSVAYYGDTHRFAVADRKRNILFGLDFPSKDTCLGSAPLANITESTLEDLLAGTKDQSNKSYTKKGNLMYVFAPSNSPWIFAFRFRDARLIEIGLFSPTAGASE